MTTHTAEHFDREYQTHLKHLNLKGLRLKTIDAYTRAIRRLGGLPLDRRPHRSPTDRLLQAP